MRKENIVLFSGIISCVLVAIFWLNPIHTKNIEELKKPNLTTEEADKLRQFYKTDSVTGTIESIHPWGRTEVVPITSIDLEYFPYTDEWVLSGDVIQPNGRKGYFMPVLTGSLTLDSYLGCQQLVECSGYGASDEGDEYQDFRVANIVLQDRKPKNILYYHYRYENNSWMIIASWEAKFTY